MTTMTVDAALARSPALVKQRSEVQTQLQLASLKLEEFQDVLAGVVSPRGFWWLGDQQDEAAELVALLNEAAPKLALSGLHTPPRQRSHLPKARSFELLPDTIRHRLARAVPVPTGPGQIDWSRLVAAVSSENVRPLVESPPATQSPRPTTTASELLQINSGGRVLFCLFETGPAASPAATPPSSLAPSPEKDHTPPGQATWSLAGSPTQSFMLDGHQPSPHDAAAALAAQAGLLEGRSEATAELVEQVLPLMAAALQAQGVPPPAAWGPMAGAEGCVVCKFVPTRLLCQSEQFAAELTRHVGLCAPDSRILRQQTKGEDSEWARAYQAAETLKQCGFPDLHDEMARSSCCMLMEFIPGRGMFKSEEAFSPQAILQTAEDLGRMFTLDQLLGNSDRLPCDELGWRGNPENVMFAHSGRWSGRLVAIDAVVQRRPPGGLVSAEDAACERLSELMLNDQGMAAAVLRDAVKTSDLALEAVDRPEVVMAFQQGLKAALESTMTIKGLLEMIADVINDWIIEFLDDIEGSDGQTTSHTTPRHSSIAPRRISSAGAGAGGPSLLASQSESSQTFKIRRINYDAKRDASVSEKMAHWKGVFREKGEELRGAVEEWQQKRAASGPRLTTGFLDGASPIVDVYELKVRLAHMLQRLRALQEASATARPVRLMRGLWISGAVGASSVYLLQHLGVTHILNATEDLLLPEPSYGFTVLRCPLRDVEEEDIGQFFLPAAEFIDAGLASGGSVLVHCHAGRSRSCSLVLAWLMRHRGLTLKKALDFVQRQRPEAAPNAGYVAALLRLEEELFGQQTVKVRKTKPELKSCPECGARVGLSAESVRVHLKLKHADWDGCQVDNVVMSPNGSNTSLSPRFPSDVHQPCSEAELSLH